MDDIEVQEFIEELELKVGYATNDQLIKLLRLAADRLETLQATLDQHTLAVIHRTSS